MTARALAPTAEGIVATADGLELSWRGWVPPRPREVVAVVHGYREHGGRYGRTGSWMRDREIAVYVVDLRGHGRSPGQRAHVGDFDRYLEDARALLRLVERRHPEVAPVLLGHSLGGWVALRLGSEGPGLVRAVVASAPMLALHPRNRPGLPAALLASIGGRILPRLEVRRPRRPELATRDPRIAQEIAADPLVTDHVTLGWYRAARSAMRRARGIARSWKLPLLVLQGTSDRIVDPRATRRWVHRASDRLVRYRELPGFRHELLQEVGREQVWSTVARWITSVESGGSPAAPDPARDRPRSGVPPSGRDDAAQRGDLAGEHR